MCVARSMGTMPLTRFLLAAVQLAVVAIIRGSCHKYRAPDGESLAHEYCSACHAFPDPSLLDKKTWQSGVLPRMAMRVGVQPKYLFDETSRSPYMAMLSTRMSDVDWSMIVKYYLTHAPDSLRYESMPEEPATDPVFFDAQAFAPVRKSSGIITLLKADSVHKRIFVGDGGLGTLQVFDYDRHRRAQVQLESPATDVIVDGNRLLVLEVGVLNPNDEAKGKLVRYEFQSPDSLRRVGVVLDSLVRPVFVRQFSPDGTGASEFIVCEYGNNRGRLAIYKPTANGYSRQVLAATPGAIRFELRDMNGDGALDLIALFAQGDERIVMFENDGKGGFGGKQRVLARFPRVYGSMYFTMRDFNGDGKLDIVYVNGDNFDYSRVLKPYHGVRILENDGHNNFEERYFFPVYGAARAQFLDFDGDGRPDILVTSNFADFARHPERGIIFLKNDGNYKFVPYDFSAAGTSQWNLTAIARLEDNALPDVIIGAMDLGNIAQLQEGGSAAQAATSQLVLENRFRAPTQINAR